MPGFFFFFIGGYNRWIYQVSQAGKILLSYFPSNILKYFMPVFISNYNFAMFLPLLAAVRQTYLFYRQRHIPVHKLCFVCCGYATCMIIRWAFWIYLQMIGLAFEKHDTHMLKQKIAQSPHDDDSKLKLEYRKIDPSFFDIVLYTYCYTYMHGLVV